MSVNSEMTALADAIREKSGRTGQMGIAAMKEAVEGISTGIDTSDATATAADIASGKTAYVGGQKITGSVTSYDSQTGWNNVTPVVSGDNLRLSRDTNIPYLFRKGFYLGTPLYKLGDASASDVAKGKTFTSASGLKLTGTFEVGGGLPSGISAIDTGTFTPTSDVTNQIKINHNLGVVPNFYFAFVEGGITDISAHAKEYVQSFGIKLPVGTNTFADVHINITSSGSITQAAQSYGDAVYKMYFKDTSFRLALCGGTLKTGVTYRWVCGVMDGIN